MNMKNEDETEKKHPSLFGKTEGKARMFRFFLIVGYLIGIWIVGFLIHNL